MKWAPSKQNNACISCDMALVPSGAASNEPLLARRPTRMRNEQSPLHQRVNIKFLLFILFNEVPFRLLQQLLPSLGHSSKTTPGNLTGS